MPLIIALDPSNAQRIMSLLEQRAAIQASHQKRLDRIMKSAREKLADKNEVLEDRVVLAIERAGEDPTKPRENWKLSTDKGMPCLIIEDPAGPRTMPTPHGADEFPHNTEPQPAPAAGESQPPK